MSASYPNSVRAFTYHTNYTDIVNDADVNGAYDEITAIENTLGLTPALSTSGGAGNFSTTPQNYGTVSARIANLEAGLVAIAGKATDSLIVHLAGTETITGVKTFSATPVISQVQVGPGGGTLTFPNATDTVALLNAAQTFLNKTLTNPTLNVSGGQVNLPAGPDTLMGRASNDNITGIKTFSTTPVISAVQNSNGYVSTFPNATDTLVTLGSVQTLNNKILTAGCTLSSLIAVYGANPVLVFSDSVTGNTKKILLTSNTIRIRNVADNADLMIVDDSGNMLLAGGLQVEGGGQSIGSAWSTYTPVVTNLGTTYTATGKYSQIGKLVTVEIQVSVTGTPSGSSAITVSLPVNCNNTIALRKVGSQYRTNAGNYLMGIVAPANPTGNYFSVYMQQGSLSMSAWTGAYPTSQVSGDAWSFGFQYESV